MGKNSEKVKQTNEIKIAAPLLDAIDIENKDITADALHTQRKFAKHIIILQLKTISRIYWLIFHFIFKIIKVILNALTLQQVIMVGSKPERSGGHLN